VRVVQLPVLVFDDDEVRPVAHVAPISHDAVSARASMWGECPSGVRQIELARLRPVDNFRVSLGARVG